MKLFGNTKKISYKTKNGENATSLEVVEPVLVQCNIVLNINKSLSFYTLLCLLNLNLDLCLKLVTTIFSKLKIDEI